MLWTKLIRCGKSSFPLAVVVLYPGSARDTTGDTETDPKRGSKTCDWKLLMPTEISPACLLMPSHPKTFLPTQSEALVVGHSLAARLWLKAWWPVLGE